MEPVGETNVIIEFENEQFIAAVVIVDNLPEMLLLGLDFLLNYKFVVDFGKLKLYKPNVKENDVSFINDQTFQVNRKSNENDIEEKRSIQSEITKSKADVNKTDRSFMKSNCQDGNCFAKMKKYKTMKNIKQNIRSKKPCMKLLVKEVFDRSQLEDQISNDAISTNLKFKSNDKINNEKLKNEFFNQDLFELIEKYNDIFSKHKFDLGNCSITKHKIITTSDRPIKSNSYRVSPFERKIISEQINELISIGVIERSNSQWSSPVILVKKKDDSYRFCVDFRRLNNITIKDNYPLPRIEDSLDALAGSKYFSSIDLTSGFWQVELDDESKNKAAFVTTEGLFQFNMMPFGLCNAPSTFQRLMDNVLLQMK